MLQALRGTLVVNKLGHLGQPYSEVIEYLALGDRIFGIRGFFDDVG